MKSPEEKYIIQDKIIKHKLQRGKLTRSSLEKKRKDEEKENVSENENETMENETHLGECRQKCVMFVFLKHCNDEDKKQSSNTMFRQVFLL